jgi:hypothetical protein
MNDAGALQAALLKLDEAQALVDGLVAVSPTLTSRDHATLGVATDNLARARRLVAQVEARADHAPESHGARRANAAGAAVELELVVEDDLVRTVEHVDEKGGSDETVNQPNN